jgi:Tol biopolymer transport system component
LISAAGAFTASAISRASVIASFGTLRDTAFVSVVPPGTYVAFESNTGNLIYGDLDGTARRVLRAGPFRDLIEPAWSPAGDEVAVAPFKLNQIEFVSLAGAVSTVTWTDDSPFQGDAYWPAYSRDGQFVYFSRVVGSANGIHRMRRQGGVLETIGPCECYRPSVSPDGRQVVFHFFTNDVVVRVWDIAAQAYVSPEVPGRFAEWSPIGNEIVFHENETGRIRIMRSDGSNIRYLTPVGRIYSQNSQISWSSAGTWILARSAASVDLINVATGLILPLSASSTLINPALRP